MEAVSLQKQSGERAGNHCLSAEAATQDYKEQEQSRKCDTTRETR